MKIKIDPNSVSFDELKTTLVREFPDLEFTERRRNFLLAKKKAIFGCNILLKRRKIVVVGNFPETSQQVMFNLAVVFLGVVLPLAVYYAFFYKKYKTFEEEIGNFLKSKYSNEEE